MKNFIKTLVISIILLAPLLLHGQQPEVVMTTRPNVVKINLISPLLRTASVFYERALSTTTSAQLGVFYSGYTSFETVFQGVGITPEFRFYLSERHPAPRGIFVAPYLRFQHFNLTFDEINDPKQVSVSFFGGGLLVGFQAILRNRVSMEVFAGPAYNHANLHIEEGSREYYDLSPLQGFTARGGITLGIVF